MFNALNRLISRLDESPSRNSTSHDGFGFQVLRNKDADLPIEPWFDFIVGINGRQVVCMNHACSVPRYELVQSKSASCSCRFFVQEDPDPHLFAQEVRNCGGASVTFGVWSAKVRSEQSNNTT